MKCTNRSYTGFHRFISIFLCCFFVITMAGCGTSQDSAEISQESRDYSLLMTLNAESELTLVPYSTANSLCVTNGDTQLAGFSDDGAIAASGLFNVTDSSVLEAQSVFSRLYPASTTKIMTAYLALKYSDLNDTVTVSENAVNLESGSQMCGLEAGDSISMKDLLYGLLLHSGNDASMAVAEHVSGSIDAFVNLMNIEAASLMAVQTHFSNPSGLHDDDHYTTVYDMYLMFNACIKNETFAMIIDTPSYAGTVTHSNGTSERITWKATNYYFQNNTQPPSNVTVLGGKTGTTDEAGSCLLLYTKDAAGKSYIAIIMKAGSKAVLYDKMNLLLSLIPASS